MMIACGRGFELQSEMVQVLLNADAQVDVKSDDDGIMCVYKNGILTQSTRLTFSRTNTYILRNNLGKM